MRILLIEDDTDIREAVSFLLSKQGYAVDTADNGLDALDLARSGIHDLLILDWMLPGRDGVSILRDLRLEGLKTPVLMLTARTSVDNRVTGLDAGADDYLMKPFATEELFARVRALGRRRTDLLPEGSQRYGDLEYDAAQSEITRNGGAVHFTQKENQLFELLFINRGRLLSKELLFDRVWGLDSDNEIGVVEIYIHYLRKKLSAIQSTVSISTVRGVGYRLEEPTC